MIKLKKTAHLALNNNHTLTKNWKEYRKDEATAYEPIV